MQVSTPLGRALFNLAKIRAKSNQGETSIHGGYEEFASTERPNLASYLAPDEANVATSSYP